MTRRFDHWTRNKTPCFKMGPCFAFCFAFETAKQGAKQFVSVISNCKISENRKAKQSETSEAASRASLKQRRRILRYGRLFRPCFGFGFTGRERPVRINLKKGRRVRNTARGSGGPARTPRNVVDRAMTNGGAHG